jgi:CheY-like chemotaxis protein
MLDLTGIYLSEAYEITGTEDPRQTLALSHKPDAILMDLRMPDYSGVEPCQSFRAHRSRCYGLP